jgi:hypothetical protein
MAIPYKLSTFCVIKKINKNIINKNIIKQKNI